MAEKKTTSNKDFVDDMLKESNKGLTTDFLETGNIGFDLALTDGRGIPLGSSILLWSEPGVGKSTIMGDICYRVLSKKKAEKEPYKVLYLATENSIELMKSLHLEEYMKSGDFIYLGKPQLCWRDIERFYDAVLSGHKTLKDVKLVVIDSITNVLSDANLNKSGADGDFGTRAKERYAFYSKYLMKALEKRVTSVFISQARTNQQAGMFMDPNKAAVANGDLHAVEIIMKCSKKSNTTDAKKKETSTVFDDKVKVQERYILTMDSSGTGRKNRFCLGLPSETLVIAGDRCDNMHALRSLLVGHGYIRKDGAWYTIDPELCKLLGIEPAKKQMTALDEILKPHIGALVGMLKEAGQYKLGNAERIVDDEEDTDEEGTEE